MPAPTTLTPIDDLTDTDLCVESLIWTVSTTPWDTTAGVLTVAAAYVDLGRILVEIGDPQWALDYIAEALWLMPAVAPLDYRIVEQMTDVVIDALTSLGCDRLAARMLDTPSSPAQIIEVVTAWLSIRDERGVA